jgi:hypothetical protein
MSLGVCFDKGYEPITCRMHHSADAGFTSRFAMLMIVLQNIDQLLLTLTGVFDISSVKVTVIAVVSANGANTVLFT